MSMSRISVKVEVDPTGDPTEDIMTALEDALDSVGEWNKEDQLTDKFFTMRFDETNRGTLSATVGVSEKKD